MRKVEFKEHTYRGLSETKKGYFHQWGLMSESNGDETYYNVTVGIIEEETGECHSIYVADIKFLEKQ
jgi:hypothetical protein